MLLMLQKDNFVMANKKKNVQFDSIKCRNSMTIMKIVKWLKRASITKRPSVGTLHKYKFFLEPLCAT